MKFNFLKRKKFWWRATLFIVLLPTTAFAILLFYVMKHQDEIIQKEVDAMNKGHKGMIFIGDTHLAPFENFPNISIKVDDVKILEYKEDSTSVILEVADIYVGLNLWDIIGGKIDIENLLIEDGFFDIILHEDGTNNLANALATTDDNKESEPLHIHLQNIELKNLDIHKKDESSGLDIETLIYWAKGGFQTSSDHIGAHIDSQFELNILSNGDTTYVKHKHFEFHTDIDLDETTGILTIEPSGITMEHADFDLKGTIDTKNAMDLDLHIQGTKSNFDMLIAFAPQELVPLLERYKNAGKIYFNADLKGQSSFGHIPFVDVTFGASEAFLENTIVGRRMDNMGFEGHFTNGVQRDISTMEFSMKNMTANLETGKFLGSMLVQNFEEPDVNMEVDAEFDLDFVADFLNLTDYQDASGSVALKMKFHDIIDLDHPEQALSDLNQAYYSELKIKDLKVSSTELPAPLKSLNAHLIMNGKKAEIDQFELKLGESDLSINGYLSNLPAIVHHTDIPVTTHLEIQSNVLDIAEITGFSEKDSTGIDERIENFSVGFSFEASAKDFTESKYLPRGEFFIDSLHAKLKHYPHELHDFHVDLLLDDRDIKIKDFTGFIDQSDFHFNGKIHDYSFWFQDTLNGDVDLDISLQSGLIRLEDVFAYQGENYVPEDYRHEEFDKLSLHLTSSMHYKDSQLHSIDIDLDKFDTKLHVHPMRFEDFHGRIHYEDEHLMIQDFHGQMGRTIFNVDMNYYLGEDQSIKKRDNHLFLKTNYIDFDQLTNFNPEPSQKPEEQTEVHTTEDVAEHAETFNLYELPFTDMQFDVDIGHFIYHRIDLQKINAHLRTTQNHYLYIDTLSMNAAGGEFHMSGYFNGSDPKHIYMKPKLDIQNVNIDQLLFKFENFGQDVIVSENLHGQLSANVTGNIRVYPDLVPDLDQSEIHMDVEALNGRLENYDYMLMLADYFGDKDLSNVRFDTLKNHIDVTNGILTIPNMTIESTLGHMDLSGTQDMDLNMEYYLRIPWSIIKQGARNRIFGSKKTKEGETGDDEIIELDPNEKVRYLNLRISGNIDDYKIRPGKKKKKKT